MDYPRHKEGEVTTTIWQIQHQEDSGRWQWTNTDLIRGFPKAHIDQCWHKTGYNGFRDFQEGVNALEKIYNDPSSPFYRRILRLVKRELIDKVTPEITIGNPIKPSQVEELSNMLKTLARETIYADRANHGTRVAADTAAKALKRLEEMNL